jgi:hypothetical protein
MNTLLLLLKGEARRHKQCGAYGLGELFSAAFDRIEKLEEAVHYASDYLDDNKLNSIGNGSKAHKELKEAIKEIES